MNEPTLAAAVSDAAAVDEKPIYLRIADALRKSIVDGDLTDGERLMPEHRLQTQFGGVSRPTVRRATALLEQEGYLRRNGERGLRVQRAPRVTVASTVDCLQVVFDPGIHQHLDFFTRNIISMFTARGQQTILTALAPRERLAQRLARDGARLAVGRKLVFFGGYEPDAEDEEALRSLGIASVVVGRAKPGCGIPQVAGNHVYGGMLLTRHLLSLGHRRVGFIAHGPEGHVVHEQVFDGYRRALESHGLSFDRSLVQGTEHVGMGEGEAAARELLARRPDATALVSVAAWMTCGVMKGVRSMERTVPDDCAVGMYFHHPWVDEACQIPMTGVSEFHDLLGEAAMRALDDQREGRAPSPLTEVVNVSLTVRRSCGAVR